MTERKRSGSFGFMTVVGLILCVVFGFTLLCNLVIIVKGSLFPEKPPSVLGKTPMVVLSGSMSGTAKDHIEIGDMIIVDAIEPEQLQVGDVIAFMEGKVVVTHRILEIRTTEEGTLEFLTKGDANNTEDQRPVSQENLVGIYRYRIPLLGHFAIFLQTPLGMILFIGVPAAAIVGYDALRRRKAIRQERQRNDAMQAELERLRALAGETADSGKSI